MLYFDINNRGYMYIYLSIIYTFLYPLFITEGSCVSYVMTEKKIWKHLLVEKFTNYLKNKIIILYWQRWGILTNEFFAFNIFLIFVSGHIYVFKRCQWLAADRWFSSVSCNNPNPDFGLYIFTSVSTFFRPVLLVPYCFFYCFYILLHQYPVSC